SCQDYGNNIISCLQFNAQKIVSASDDWCIKVYNTSNSKIIHRLECHEGDVNALQYINTVLASGSANNTVQNIILTSLLNFKSDHSYCFTKSLSDNNQQYPLHTFCGHTDSVNALASSGKTLISGSDDGRCAGCKISCFQHNVDKLICGTNEALHIWDMKSGKRVCDLLTGLSV
ncbi:1015_t:CDS:2, partial [Entrophospora sp. SA101]